MRGIRAMWGDQEGCERIGRDVRGIGGMWELELVRNS